jgi:hypothetical protein
MRTHFTIAVLTLVLMTGLVLGTTGCDENNGNDNDNTNDNTNQNNTPIPAIDAVDQTLNDLSTVVSVADVVSTGPGWVVIHVDDIGTPGAVVGMAAVSAGSTMGVNVILGGPAADDDSFIAMLHEDLGVVGTWEPAEDVPAMNGMDTVVSTFTVTVPAATPAVRITVTSVGMSAYDFTAAEPAAFADLIGAEADNQSLTLMAGWRYEVVNQASGGHPFELLTVGANPTPDTVLLSQSAAGTLEGDADINWADDAGQTVQFTVAPTLTTALDGYRCSIHTTTMRSGVSITP